jgi:hypothetical protein
MGEPKNRTCSPLLAVSGYGMIHMNHSFLPVVLLTATSLACLLTSCPSHAQNNRDPADGVKEIAAALRKGNKAQAEKMAAAEAGKLKEYADLMKLLRSEQKGGLGANDGYIVAAIAEIALAKPPRKDGAAWLRHAKALREQSLQFANAQAGQKKNALRALNDTCNACHKQFRD